MSIFSRRDLIRSLGPSSVAGPTSAPASAAKMRISRYEVIPTVVSMDIRVRDAWQQSGFSTRRLWTSIGLHKSTDMS